MGGSFKVAHVLAGVFFRDVFVKLPSFVKPERQWLPQPGVDLKAFNLAGCFQLADNVSVTQLWSGCSQKPDLRRTTVEERNQSNTYRNASRSRRRFQNSLNPGTAVQPEAILNDLLERRAKRR